MGGGSMGYLYAHVRDVTFTESTPERRAFRKHLRLVADALRYIEWADSGDHPSDSEEVAVITACLGDARILEQLIVEAREAAAALAAALAKAGG